MNNFFLKILLCSVILLCSCNSITIPIEVKKEDENVTSKSQLKYTTANNLRAVLSDEISDEVDFEHKWYGTYGIIYFPRNITKLSTQLFAKNNYVTSVSINGNITSIDKAFSGCSRLTNITIPNSVTEIGIYAFDGCSSLTSVTIPDSVTTIGNWAFQDCSSLTNITIPNSVTEIGEYAFSSCSSMTSVTIPNSVTEIGEYAFYKCSSLTSIIIPDSVTSIEGWAFSKCVNLTHIVIGNSVRSIGYSAFDYCDYLTRVYCKSTTPPIIYNNIFYKSRSKVYIYVPTASVNRYKSTWGLYCEDCHIEGYNFN
ncbi:MAG: leucine-rich repeat domain-containing protein [Alistipes sp.]|nr:leucine-rich repeat domain-containing protein [Alistipes sp.]